MKSYALEGPEINFKIGARGGAESERQESNPTQDHPHMNALETRRLAGALGARRRVPLAFIAAPPHPFAPALNEEII